MGISLARPYYHPGARAENQGIAAAVSAATNGQHEKKQARAAKPASYCCFLVRIGYQKILLRR